MRHWMAHFPHRHGLLPRDLAAWRSAERLPELATLVALTRPGFEGDLPDGLNRRVEVPAIGPFDSSVPVVAIAELLVSQVARDLHEQATARIDRIEALWEASEVFL